MFNFFRFDSRSLFLFALVVALPLISINFQRDPDEPPILLKPLSYLSGSLQLGISGFTSGVRDTTKRYLNLLDIKTENRELKKEISTLRTTLSRFNELQLENDRLNQLLGFASKSPSRLVPAKIISPTDLLASHSTLRINRGSSHGIRKGQAVVTPNGVVGTIYNAERFSSQVLVITDRYSVIDALIQRSRVRGIVKGLSKGSCQIRYLQRTDDVKVGDQIVTSGLDKAFPKGIPIGIVTEVQKQSFGITQQVELKPLVNPMQLEEVFIVISPKEEEEPSLANPEDVKAQNNES